MRVLFYVHSLGSGGAERITVSIANHWAKLGWSIIVVTNTDSVSDFYTLHPAIQRIALRLSGHSSNLGSAVIANWKRVMRLRAILKGACPEVAIGMMTAAGCSLALAGYRLKIFCIGSERVHPPEFPLGRVWTFVRKRTYPLLNVVVAQTSTTADWLRTNVPGTRVAVIGNPVCIPLPRRAPEMDPESIVQKFGRPKILLAVGRLEPQKGFDILISAFGELRSLRQEWILVILGEGPSRKELEKEVRIRGWQGRVIMPGAVGNVGDWYSTSDLFVLSSRYEGFPNCLLEAMAYGMPVIAFDCKTGPSDIIHDGVNGVLVPSGDKKALAVKLLELMNNPNKRERIASRGRDVLERYSLPTISNLWCQLFDVGSLDE